ncbi:hypothetical protein V8B97DRAFT_1844452, partial [Scleroderma yunnanense]
MPVIQAINWSVCADNSLQADRLVSCLFSDQFYIISTLEAPKSDTTTGDNQKFDDEVLVLFLPLLDAFNSDDTQDWWYLTQHIQEWLLKIPCESQQWIWGHDLFWLVFMGAHPTFPLGKWPLWDKRIPLEGPYIEDLVQLSIA